MGKKRNSVPRLSSGKKKQAFRSKQSFSGRLDWSKAVRVRFPNLKPSVQVISLRLPVDMLERIKVAANRRDVAFQSLIKIWLEERLQSTQP